VSDTPNPLDRLLDLVVYAPLGLVFRAREELPTLAAQGRQKVTAQAGLARMVGQMAVAQGRRRVEGLFSRSEAAKPVPLQPGRPVPVRDLAGEADPPHPVVVGEVLPEPTENDIEPTSDRSPAAADLPIPGYDTLSASQVVQRLAGLSPTELEAVRAYEAAGRARKTVLLRVAQLRAAS
jgi:hypothetical protein